MKVDAILAADIHLRDDTPECRTDDYWAAQQSKITWLRNLAEEHACPVIVAGDIFDKWRVSPGLEAWVIDNLPWPMIVVPGQHDLPGHSLRRLNESSLQVLQASGVANIVPPGSAFLPDPLILPLRRQVAAQPTQRGKGSTQSGNSELHTCRPLQAEIWGYPWQTPLEPPQTKGKLPSIAICHTLVWVRTAPWPGADGSGAGKLLRKFKDVDLIVTGDNHSPCVVEHEGRLLVNPGSLMRMSADQLAHRPRVYLWNAKKNTVEPEYVPIEDGVVSRAHVDIKNERDERMEAFVKQLNTDVEVTVSFERNLNAMYKKNKISKKVREIIATAMEAT